MPRISELHYADPFVVSSGVNEFVEVALGASEDPADFTVSLYNSDGTVGLEIVLTDPGVVVTTDPDNNEQVFVISADNFTFLLTDPDAPVPVNDTIFEAVALTNTSTNQVIDFYDIGGGTQNITAIDGLAAGATSENLVVLTGPGSTTTSLQFNQPNPNTLVHADVSPGDSGAACFTAGTLVDTPDGPRRIETLEAGDLVNTVDNGSLPISWIGGSTVSGRGRFAPIRISAGTLGAKNDVLISPQHQVLITGWQAQLLFGEHEVLVPAKAQVNGATVTAVPCDIVRYIHMMFDRHQLVITSGLVSESFFPGQEGLDGLGSDATDEILTLFPNLRDCPETYGEIARPVRQDRTTALLRCA